MRNFRVKNGPKTTCLGKKIFREVVFRPYGDKYSDSKIFSKHSNSSENKSFKVQNFFHFGLIVFFFIKTFRCGFVLFRYRKNLSNRKYTTWKTFYSCISQNLAFKMMNFKKICSILFTVFILHGEF